MAYEYLQDPKIKGLLAVVDTKKAELENAQATVTAAIEAYQKAQPILKRLHFAATMRCSCGAGLAYDPAGLSGGVGNTDGPFKGPLNGYWDCSAIILGTADKEKQHTEHLPFSFYEIKSENQPSANGRTTRPSGGG